MIGNDDTGDGGRETHPALPVLVINLARRPDRRRAIESRLAAAGLDATFLVAVDGATLAAGRVFPSLSRGEHACYLSHVAAWTRLVDGGEPAALILEDDVRFAPALVAVCERLATLPIDLIRLGSVMPPRGLPIAILPEGSRLLAPTANASGAHAYLLTRSGAQRLLRDFASPRRPIDRVFDSGWQHGLDILLLDPPPVTVDAQGSDIAAAGPRMRRERRAGRIGRWLGQIRRTLHALRLRQRVRRSWRSGPVVSGLRRCEAGVG